MSKILVMFDNCYLLRWML